MRSATSHSDRKNILASLQRDIIRLQGFNTLTGSNHNVGLDFIKEVFPNGSFPVGAVHEFLADTPENAASTTGFISGLLSFLMKASGTSIWISDRRRLFPPALKSFGLEPDRFIFIDLKNEKDVLWAVREALKCSAVTAVIGEVNDISFTSSRRLQLAVEQSQVTGFIVRHSLRKPGITACVSRWRITSIPSETPEGLPGIGFPKWNTELLRMRNGKCGTWEIQWINGSFSLLKSYSNSLPISSSEDDLLIQQAG